MLWMYQVMNLVGQAGPPKPWEDAEPADPGAVAARPMRFSDLQKGLRAQLNGETNDWYYRNLLLAITLMVVLFAVLLYIRNRRKSGVASNSVRTLRRELSRGISYPWGTRLLLWWVARSVRVPVALLLISGEVFEKSVGEWRAQHTFALLRQWGAGRLARLRRTLFEADAEGKGQAACGGRAPGTQV